MGLFYNIPSTGVTIGGIRRGEWKGEKGGKGRGNGLLVEQTWVVFALHKPAFNGQQIPANQSAFIF